MKEEKTHKNNILKESHLEDYLQDRLSNQDRHAFETEITDDPFLSDALDGLNEIENPSTPLQINEQLKHFINKKIAPKKEKRIRPIYFPNWLMLLAAVVFLMAIVGIVLIKWLSH